MENYYFIIPFAVFKFFFQIIFRHSFPVIDSRHQTFTVNNLKSFKKKKKSGKKKINKSDLRSTTTHWYCNIKHFLKNHCNGPPKLQ